MTHKVTQGWVTYVLVSIGLLRRVINPPYELLFVTQGCVTYGYIFVLLYIGSLRSSEGLLRRPAGFSQ